MDLLISGKYNMVQSCSSVNIAIERKNPELFNSSYVLLTNTCSTCHQVARFEFNVVQIPETQTISNQDFKNHQ